MNIKKIIIIILVFICSLGLCSCELFGFEIGDTMPNSNEKYLSMKVEKLDTPTFDAYSKRKNDNDTGYIDYYYFNVGTLKNVPIVYSSPQLKNDYNDLSFSYKLTEATETSINLALSSAVGLTCSSNYTTGYGIVPGTQNSYNKTITYSIKNVDSISTTNYYSIASQTLENSFFNNSSVISEINAKSTASSDEISLFSTEKWADKFDSTNSVLSANSYIENSNITKSTKIVNAYTSYKNSSITKSKSSTYTVDATDPKGYYSYGLFNSYYVYMILVLKLHQI